MSSSHILTTTKDFSSPSTQETCKRLLKPSRTVASMTLAQHQAKWQNCQACPLHQNRTQVVTFRGDNPCDVLLVGEAPGRSEDALGEPFVGEAGYCLKEIIDICFTQHCRLLISHSEPPEYDILYRPKMLASEGVDKIVWDNQGSIQARHFVSAVHDAYPPIKIGISNICCCLPLGEPEVPNGLPPIRPPEKEEALACRPRLLELIKIVKPRAIVTLGKVPSRFRPKLTEGLPPSVGYLEEVIHPSALLRLQKEDPIRYQESYNRTILTLTRLKYRLWGIEV